jgi:peptidoglycan/LPS O-acetylase OafA/YrhL
MRSVVILGLAWDLIVIAHAYLSIGWPADSFDRPFIFRLPFFHLILEGGKLSIGIFFAMSGYVCAYKPLRLARAGKAEDARKVIASSGFRRLLRLGLPSSIAVTISWA